MPHSYKQDMPMDIYPMRLTAKHARVCRAFVDGNLSLGGRTAIEFMKFSIDAAKNGDIVAKELLDSFWQKKEKPSL